MSVFYFLSGATPALSRLELSSVIQTEIAPVGQTRLLQANLDSEEAAKTVFSQLGGSVKLYAMVAELAAADAGELLARLAEQMSEFAIDKSIDFGFVEYGHAQFGQFGLQEIKVELKKLGIRSRYLKQEGTGLSAAVLLHQHKVQDWCLIHDQEKMLLARTIAVQDIDDWTLRDRAKPYADRKKGMLPPKLARIMVNLALENTEKNLMAGQTLLDPFCGSGTVLMEAALRGVQVVGSDLDRTAVTGTTANMRWLRENYPVTVASEISYSDATNLALSIKPGSVNYLVTEPFLGKPKPQPEAMANIFKGLEKLYLGAFKHWTKWLADGARLVVVLPYVQTEKHTYSHQKLIDKLKDWGYTLTVDPVLYARPQAIVQRQIVIFTWKRSK
jgi:tRNA G10  N-methylase Trm11